MICSAVVVAAGRGTRFGAPRNKVLLPLRGRNVLEVAADALAEVSEIEEIIVVANPGELSDLDATRNRIGRGKCTKIVAGGSQRMDSVAAGVRATNPGAALVAIHDAARPLVDPADVRRTIGAALRCGGALLAAPAVDSIKLSRDGTFVDQGIPRNEVFLAQTPQIFRRADYLHALDQARNIDRVFTDDVEIAQFGGMRVEIVTTEKPNVKITHPGDLKQAERLLAARDGRAPESAVRVGNGFDIHRMVPGRRCVIGGVEIEHARGPQGHSDGDVLLHAIADAVLGAAGEDDLGTLFPDRDPRYKNADSRELLRLSVMRARDAGFVVINADCVVIAEEPRLAPHRKSIRESVAQLLEIDPAAVNVKGKTAEGLGPIGSGDAIAAQCVLLLQKIRS